jgi:hypothetical protein
MSPYLAGVFITFAAACLCPAADLADSERQKNGTGFKFAPEFHFFEDLHVFFHQKEEFKNRYFIEWYNSAELAFFSCRDRFFFFGEMESTVGLGKWPDKAILFDPRDIDLGFGPMFEYRFAPVNVSLGLDHHCFHGIDTLDFEPVYWNKISVLVSSKQFRPEAFREALAGQGTLSWNRRISWQAGAAYSLHDFFGFDTSVVSWNQPYLVDLTGEARCAVARFKGIAVIVGARTGAYFTRTHTTLWNQQFYAQLLATQGLFGLDIFVNWVALDQLPPRQNKDGLVSLGINGFR